MKRLFIAVDVDDATRETIGRITSQLRRQIDPHVKATWVNPDRIHLTLHFFGDADPAMEARILDALREPIRRAPFDVAFDGLGSFPERGSPRVLWLGLRDGVDALRDIHTELARRLAIAAERELTPHLTLARFRDRVRRDQIGEITRMAAAAGPCAIDRVTLYQSRLLPAGPTYARLAEARLQL